WPCLHRCGDDGSWLSLVPERPQGWGSCCYKAFGGLSLRRDSLRLSNLIGGFAQCDNAAIAQESRALAVKPTKDLCFSAPVGNRPQTESSMHPRCLKGS